MHCVNLLNAFFCRIMGNKLYVFPNSFGEYAHEGKTIVLTLRTLTLLYKANRLSQEYTGQETQKLIHHKMSRRKLCPVAQA